MSVSKQACARLQFYTGFDGHFWREGVSLSLGDTGKWSDTVNVPWYRRGVDP